MKKPGFHYQETFGQNIYYFIGWSAKEFTDYCKRNFDYDPRITAGQAGKSIQFTLKEVTGAPICIWVYDKKKTTVIAHECLHAANYILGDASVIPSFDNDEVQAYLLEEIMKGALK